VTTFLIVAQYQHALEWCREQDPPRNPRARDLVIISVDSNDATFRLRGRRMQDGDEVVEHVIYSHLSQRGWETLGAVEHELDMMRRFSV